MARYTLVPLGTHPQIYILHIASPTSMCISAELKWGLLIRVCLFVCLFEDSQGPRAGYALSPGLREIVLRGT
jgi:hypothetical protein